MKGKLLVESLSTFHIEIFTKSMLNIIVMKISPMMVSNQDEFACYRNDWVNVLPAVAVTWLSTAGPGLSSHGGGGGGGGGG